MIALLPIKPKYAAKILDGSKRFEFRKRPFGRKVESVVIYASSPVKKVVGEFTLLGYVKGNKELVWQECKDYAGIDRALYDGYYANSEEACALKICKVIRYEHPRDLSTTYGIKPPQSFCYLPD